MFRSSFGHRHPGTDIQRHQPDDSPSCAETASSAIRRALSTSPIRSVFSATSATLQTVSVAFGLALRHASVDQAASAAAMSPSASAATTTPHSRRLRNSSPTSLRQSTTSSAAARAPADLPWPGRTNSRVGRSCTAFSSHHRIAPRWLAPDIDAEVRQLGEIALQRQSAIPRYQFDIARESESHCRSVSAMSRPFFAAARRQTGSPVHMIAWVACMAVICVVSIRRPPCSARPMLRRCTVRGLGIEHDDVAASTRQRTCQQHRIADSRAIECSVRLDLPDKRR